MKREITGNYVLSRLFIVVAILMTGLSSIQAAEEWKQSGYSVPAMQSLRGYGRVGLENQTLTAANVSHSRVRVRKRPMP